jgi:S1-C subfamily serine protease
MDELVALLRRHSVGDTIDLTIERGAQQQIVSVVLGER